MNRTNKISNLYRVTFKNKLIVISYLFKKLIKLRPNKKERFIYNYYNILINTNGALIEENEKSYISEFKQNFSKRIKIRKQPSSDIEVLKQIFIFKEYLPVVKIYQENFINEVGYTMNIIDAGSNIGLTSLFFLDYFKNSNIICVEPNPETFEVLEYNLQKSTNSNLVKINGAVWNSNTRIKIVKDFRDQLEWSFRVEETDDEDGIQAFTISQLMRNSSYESIDILKIDVEGAEKQLFTSPNSNIDFLKVTKCLAIEIHDEFDCREEIYQILSKYGFSFENHGELTICINENLK